MDTLRRSGIVTGIFFIAAVALSLVLASCATVNRLDRYDFSGATLSADMQTPPVPELDIRYDVTLDRKNPIYSSLSVMSNLAKASQAEKTRQAMRDALVTVDVPTIILDQSFAACVTTLGAVPENRGSRSSFLLDLDIRDWGIRADSPTSAVSLRIRVNARLYSSFDRELVWQRDVTVSQRASPAMFGFDQIVDNIVTATALSNMTAHGMANGFRELARESARSIARLLEKDLDSARYGRW